MLERLELRKATEVLRTRCHDGAHVGESAGNEGSDGLVKRVEVDRLLPVVRDRWERAED